jgi:hypothetical protein
MSAELHEVAPRRRASDAGDETIRRQAIAAVFDGCVDRGERITLAMVDRLCREFLARVRALEGEA